MKPVQLTDSNFEIEVIQSDKPVVVDFWAAWCGPCKMIAPIIEEIASEYDNKIKVGKIDVDSNPQTAIKYGVRSIPTVLFIRNGEVTDKIIGAVPKSQFIQKLKSI
jgi:thioredoxin 1